MRAADEACGPLPTRLERIESGDLPAEDHHSNHMQQQQEQQQQDRERGSRLSAASNRPHHEGVSGVARSPRGPRPRLAQQQDLAAAATAAAAALAFSSPMAMPGGRLSPSSFAPPWGRGTHQRGSQHGMLYGSNSAGVGGGTRRGSSESSTASHHTATTGSGALAAAAAAAAAAAVASSGVSPRGADTVSVGAGAGDTGFTFSPPHPVVSPALGTANSLGRSAGVASGGAGRWDGGGAAGHVYQQQHPQQLLSPGQGQGSFEANRSLPDSPRMDPGDTKVLEMFARLLTQVSVL